MNMNRIFFEKVWTRVIVSVFTGILLAWGVSVEESRAQSESVMFWVSQESQTINKADPETGSSQIMKMGLGENAKHIFVDTVHDHLYWIGGTDIRRIGLDGTRPAIVFNNVSRGNIGGMTIDAANRLLYWSESDSARVRRMNIETGNVVTVIDSTDGLEFPWDLAVAGDSLFILDKGLKKVALDGSGLRTLDDEYTRAMSLSLDAVNNKVYWTTRDDGGLLLRADLDGSNRETVAASQNPQGITVDGSAGVIYWISLSFNRTLLKSDLDGENVVTLYETQNDLADTHLDGDGNLYWSKDKTAFSTGPGMIWRRSTDETTTVFMKELSIAEIALDYEDGHVFWINYGDGSLLRSDVNFQQSDTLVRDGNFFNLSKLAVDPDANRIFYAFGETIYSNNYQGTASDSITSHVGIVSGIAVDASQSMLYWTDNGSTTFGNLKSVNYETGEAETLINQNLSYARSLKVAPASGKLYWATGSSFTGNIGINTAALTGTNVDLLYGISGSVKSVHAITLDKEAGLVFFSDSEGQAVYSINVENGGDLQTVLMDIDVPLGLDISRGISTDLKPQPGEQANDFQLRNNYPNPFNPTTTIQYSLPRAEFVRLAVYDMLGREVAVLTDGRQLAGQHEVQFDAAGLASGAYIYRLETAGSSRLRKMLLIK